MGKFLRNSEDKGQILMFWDAAVGHGNSVNELAENLALNDDDKQITELLVRPKIARNKQEGIIKAFENAINSSINLRFPKCSHREQSDADPI